MTDTDVHLVAISVNGTRHEVAVEPRRTLADVLRHDLGYTGTHLGCEHGICGACTVLVDGEPTRACLMFGVQADDCEVETVEGLADGDTLHPLQQAFTDHHALQCGFCTPGFLMLAAALLRRTPDPSDEEIREAMASNLCRCTGYSSILDAVRAVARGDEAAADASGNGRVRADVAVENGGS
jgi:aerobic-type carbon monoxide dehydrogenase small subunit (CoxS/CutS family)